MTENGHENYKSGIHKARGRAEFCSPPPIIPEKKEILEILLTKRWNAKGNL